MKKRWTTLVPKKHGVTVSTTASDWGCLNGTAHHWRLAEPGGGEEMVSGTCLRCEATRSNFRVWGDDFDGREFNGFSGEYRAQKVG